MVTKSTAAGIASTATIRKNRTTRSICKASSLNQPDTQDPSGRSRCRCGEPPSPPGVTPARLGQNRRRSHATNASLRISSAITSRSLAVVSRAPHGAGRGSGTPAAPARSPGGGAGAADRGGHGLAPGGGGNDAECSGHRRHHQQRGEPAGPAGQNTGTRHARSSSQGLRQGRWVRSRRQSVARQSSSQRRSVPTRQPTGKVPGKLRPGRRPKGCPSRARDLRWRRDARDGWALVGLSMT